MGQATGRTAYKLVVFNSRGRVLGTVYVDDDEQSNRATCNDCSISYDHHRDVAHSVDWIESHEHVTAGEVLPSVSIEREPMETWDRSLGGQR